MSFHNARMLCFWNLVEFITPRFSFLKPECFFVPFLHVGTPTFSIRFGCFFVFSIFLCDETNASSTFEHYQALVSPFLLLFLLSGFFPFWTKLQATNSQVWLLLEFLFVSPRTTYVPWELFFSIN